MAATLPLLSAGALALTGRALAAAPAAPAPVATQVVPSESVAFAAGFNAAWNRHDVTGVLTYFAAGAVVQQRHADLVSGDSYVEVRDAYGRRATLPRAPALTRGGVAGAVGHLNPDGTISWAIGWEEIGPWAASLFDDQHQVEASGYRAVGQSVRWSYRVRVEPYRSIAGVPPTEGIAEATIRSGKIIALTLASNPASVARRDLAVQAAERKASARATALWLAAHPAPDAALPRSQAAQPGLATTPAFQTDDHQFDTRTNYAPQGPDTQGRTTPSTAAWGAAVVLTLLIAVAAGVAAPRSPRL